MQQLIAARGLIDNPDNGYVADVMLANPGGAGQAGQAHRVAQAADRLAQPVIAEGTDRGRGHPRPGHVREQSGPGRHRLHRQGRVVGGVSNETPLRTEVIPDRRSQETWIQSTRRLVPYVTDPKAATKLTGIA